MGYDIHELTPHPDAEANKKAYRDMLEGLRLKVAALTGTEHHGSRLTPAEEEGGTLNLNAEERQAIADERLRVLVDEAKKVIEGETWGDLKKYVLAHQEQPPSAEYLAAEAAYHDELMKDVTFENDPYFRLNNQGMRVYYNQMRDLGMLHDLPEDADGDWPEVDIPSEIYMELDEVKYKHERGYKWDREHVATSLRQDLSTLEAMDGWDPVYIDRYLDLQEANLEHLSRRVEGAPGICSIKFNGNEGWVVSPEEATSAAGIWDALPQERKDEVIESLGDYWLQWIEYLRNSGTRDGFCVN